MVKDKTKMWRYSPEKKLLLQWLEDGEVGQSDEPRQVYLMHEGFWQFKYENFTNNLRNLKIKVMQSKGRAVVDAVGFENDRRLFPPTINSLRGYPHWPDSDAEYFLKQDLDENIDELLEPKAFHQFRDAYLLFPLNVFRAHIYQERRSRYMRAYWLYKKRKAAADAIEEERVEEEIAEEGQMMEEAELTEGATIEEGETTEEDTAEEDDYRTRY
jgi:hypothetical protein